MANVIPKLSTQHSSPHTAPPTACQLFYSEFPTDTPWRDAHARRVAAAYIFGARNVYESSCCCMHVLLLLLQIVFITARPREETERLFGKCGRSSESALQPARDIAWIFSHSKVIYIV